MKKQELRKIYKQKRKELSEKQKNTFQNNVNKQVFALDYTTVNTVHIFLTIKRHNEFNTKPIIDFFRDQQKTIIISKSNFETNILEHFIYDKSTVIKTNAWGIPEPVNGEKIDAQKIDLVFVPLLISDKKNYRVGYGKGFYDRFLESCNPSVKTIGLNFFKPIAKIEDINKFDIALDTVIFPV